MRKVQNDRRAIDTIRTALNSEYGFKPNLGQIEVLTCSDDYTHITARVGKYRYEFKSYVCDPTTGSVWCGEGLVKKVGTYRWNGGGYDYVEITQG